MKNAIVVVDIGGTSDPEKRAMYDLSFRSIRTYADRIGADLIKVDRPFYSLKKPGLPPHLEKLEAIHLLSKYERTLSLDLDILINPAAPDIFAAHPGGLLTYGYDEGQLPWVADDIKLFEERYKVEFPVGPSGHKRMLNGGVMLWSKRTQPIAKWFDPDTFYASFGGTAGEQSWVNTKLVEYSVPCGYLDQKWNYCIYSDAALFDNRLDAYFLHYASDGHWIGKPSKYMQIQKDYREWARQELGL